MDHLSLLTLQLKQEPSNVEISYQFSKSFICDHIFTIKICSAKLKDHYQLSTSWLGWILLANIPTLVTPRKQRSRITFQKSQPVLSDSRYFPLRESNVSTVSFNISPISRSSFLPFLRVPCQRLPSNTLLRPSKPFPFPEHNAFVDYGSWHPLW